ncbi:hypothetical protein GCM10023310_13460 [Paenibacillus vulneris]
MRLQTLSVILNAARASDAPFSSKGPVYSRLGRFPGLWSCTEASPSHSGSEQWHYETLPPKYSGGTAPDSHRLPF